MQRIGRVIVTKEDAVCQVMSRTSPDSFDKPFPLLANIAFCFPPDFVHHLAHALHKRPLITITSVRRPHLHGRRNNRRIYRQPNDQYGVNGEMVKEPYAPCLNIDVTTTQEDVVLQSFVNNRRNEDRVVERSGKTEALNPL